MLKILQQLTVETWRIWTDAAPYVLFGFLAAGLIKATLWEEVVARHLGVVQPRQSSKLHFSASPCRSAPAA